MCFGQLVGSAGAQYTAGVVDGGGGGVGAQLGAEDGNLGVGLGHLELFGGGFDTGGPDDADDIGGFWIVLVGEQGGDGAFAVGGDDDDGVFGDVVEDAL